MSCPDPTAEFETATPEIAQGWLGFNRHNRPLRDRLVQRYAEAMRSGKWLPNCAPIRFDPDGFLIDGQHRLSAIALSGETLEVLVARNVPFESFSTFDNRLGARTAADTIRVSGQERYAPDIAAAAGILAWVEAGTPSRGRLVANVELTEITRLHPGLAESVHFVRSLKPDHVVPTPIVALFHYLGGKRSKRDADHFATDVATGAELRRDTPAFRLRRRFRELKSSRTRADRGQQVLLCAAAWNAFREGKRPRSIRTPKSFPRLK